jgi:hypothetical protein
MLTPVTTTELSVQQGRRFTKSKCFHFLYQTIISRRYSYPGAGWPSPRVKDCRSSALALHDASLRHETIHNNPGERFGRGSRWLSLLQQVIQARTQSLPCHLAFFLVFLPHIHYNRHSGAGRVSLNYGASTHTAERLRGEELSMFVVTDGFCRRIGVRKFAAAVSYCWTVVGPLVVRSCWGKV